ncbi:putative leader peptide [Streptomyces sp. NPDC048720]
MADGGSSDGVRHRTRVLRTVRLHSRPHIDLQRVASALCHP